MSERTSELILIFIVIVIIIVLPPLFSSCTGYEADEETLILYARAAGIYAEGRFTESAELLSSIKKFPPALTLKGKAEFFSNNEDEAEKSLRRALELRPQDAEASLFLARLLRESGRHKEAVQISETLLANNPQDLRALRLAADLAREKGPAGESSAAAFLDRAVEASGEAALVFLDRARLRWKEGDGSGALEDIARAGAVLPAGSPLKRSIDSFEKTIRSVIQNNEGENHP